MIRILYGLEAADGGALKHLMYLAVNLDKRRFDITVALSPVRNPSIDSEICILRSSGIRVILLPMARNINPAKDWLSFVQVVRLISRLKPDIVHAHSSKAGVLFRLAAFLLRTPKIYYTPHSFFFQGKKGASRFFFSSIERMMAGITDRIIVSKAEKEEALRQHICTAEKLSNINNAIKFTDYTSSSPAADIRKKYEIPEDHIIIGTVGRLEKQKNLTLFLRIAKSISTRFEHVHFVIAGKGKDLPGVSVLIKELNLQQKVLLTGHIKSIQEIHLINDIFLATSLWEGQPYSLIEAALFSKPIITTFPSEFNFIDQQCSHDGTIEHIVDNIERLIENKDLAREAGERNFNMLLHKHSFSSFLERHTNLYLQR